MTRRPTNPIEDTLRRAEYEHVRERQPALLDTVRRLMDAGQTPRQVERHVERMGPEYHGVARSCYYAALHLLSNPAERHL